MKGLYMKNFLKKIIVGCTICTMLFSSTLQIVSAAVNNGVPADIASNAIEGWPQMGAMYSETAVLMDADTGTVLCDKGMNETRYPASITKIMTTYLALENSNLSDQVTFTEAGLARMLEGTNIAMQVGEVLTMEQCLYVVMIQSANEVATQVAIQVAGSEAAFAEMMNAKAQELGCTNTHFSNASGLPDENHYTTAHDMALIFRAALQNEEFRKIIGTLSYTVEPTNMNPEPRTYTTHHALMSPAAPEHYEGCIGGKTGVTQVALNTLVTGAKRDNLELIAVTLRADPGQVCADSTALFDYGFNNFTKTELNEGSVILPNGVTMDDLSVEESEQDGKTIQTYYYGDKIMGTSVKTGSDGEAEEEEPEETPEPAIADDSAQPTNPMLENKGFAVTVGVLGGLIVLGILMIIIKLFTRKKY